MALDGPGQHTKIAGLYRVFMILLIFYLNCLLLCKRRGGRERSWGTGSEDYLLTMNSGLEKEWELAAAYFSAIVQSLSGGR